MTLEENKALLRRCFDQVWSEGNLDVVEEIYAPDFISHQHGHPRGPHDVRGIEGIKAFVREFHSAFPDFHDRIEDQVAEGDKVVTRYISAGTQRGPLMGVQATNRRVSWSGTTIDRVVDGKIAENWVNWDMMAMMQELGAIPRST